MNYDVDYFINKFEAIPEDKWCTGNYIDKAGNHCALGHCGERAVLGGLTEEAKALSGLFTQIDDEPAGVNDGHSDAYNQPTPKQRILSALRDIKAKEVA